MTWGLTAVAGATLISGAISSNASRSAAKTQAAAADQATDVQREMFERQVGLQEPWRRSGIAAQNRLLTLLGIAPEGAAPSGGGGGFGVAGSIANAIAQSGVTGPRLQVNPNDPNFGRYAKEFGMQQFQQDPGYAFRLSEGMKALERSAAARGGLVSGATMKGIQRFGQDLASQEYANAFNRYQIERNAALNPLQSLAGMGQTTAQQIGQAGMMAGQNMGQTMMGAGAARASGYVGQANALNQALGTGLNFYQGQNYLDVLRNRGGGTAAPISAAAPVAFDPSYGAGVYGGSL
jgi:hypothetical protein